MLPIASGIDEASPRSGENQAWRQGRVFEQDGLLMSREKGHVKRGLYRSFESMPKYDIGVMSELQSDE